MSERKKPGFATLAVHGSKHVDKHEGSGPIRSVSTPIFMSSTFAFANADQGARLFAGEEEGYVYTRLGNPTTAALEREMAFLEEGEAALACASGMGATTVACLTLCGAGDRIVASNTLYGGTHQLFAQTLPRLGIEVVEVDARDPAKVASAIDDRTRLVHIETPANPTLALIDIREVAEVCRRRGVPLMVDNTFATPYLQQPLTLGADIVLHSATKYIGGHGDVVAGVLVGSREFIDRARGEGMRDLGPVLSPFNSWLLLRGLKTLPVRMEKHCENAMEVAQFLEFHPAVEKVLYPGLRIHPRHALAKTQMRGFGGMVSFLVKGGREAGRMVMDRVGLWTLAVSLGDVDSLIEHPASMTHSTYNEEQLAEAGIGPGLVRLSVGLEDVDDLVDDLKQALEPLVHPVPAGSRH